MLIPADIVQVLALLFSHMSGVLRLMLSLTVLGKDLKGENDHDQLILE